MQHQQGPIEPAKGERRGRHGRDASMTQSASGLSTDKLRTIVLACEAYCQVTDALAHIRGGNKDEIRILEQDAESRWTAEGPKRRGPYVGIGPVGSDGKVQAPYSVNFHVPGLGKPGSDGTEFRFVVSEANLADIERHLVEMVAPYSKEEIAAAVLRTHFHFDYANIVQTAYEKAPDGGALRAAFDNTPLALGDVAAPTPGPTATKAPDRAGTFGIR